jgi:hypothetical protein
MYERETNDNSAREIASTPNLVKTYVGIENRKSVKVVHAASDSRPLELVSFRLRTVNTSLAPNMT